MRKSSITAFLITILMLGASAAASANIVTFDNGSGPLNDAIPYTEDGIVITSPIVPPQAPPWITDNYPSGNVAGKALFFDDTAGSTMYYLTIGLVDGSAFDMQSITFNWAQSYAGDYFEMYVIDGSATDYVASIPYVDSVTTGPLTFNFPDWYYFQDVTSVSLLFYGYDPNNITGFAAINFAIDDIVVNPVPIPSAVWLFGSGLIGLIGLARRKA